MLDKRLLCVIGSIERMAIHRTLRQTDLEKRLKILRQQFYGKSSDQKPARSEHLAHYTATPASSTTSTALRNDISYLNSDLLKILTFSSIAIGVQIILYFLLKNQVLNINFF